MHLIVATALATCETARFVHCQRRWRTQTLNVCLWEHWALKQSKLSCDFLASESLIINYTWYNWHVNICRIFRFSTMRERAGADTCHCLYRQSLLHTDGGAASPAGSGGDMFFWDELAFCKTCFHSRRLTIDAKLHPEATRTQLCLWSPPTGKAPFNWMSHAAAAAATVPSRGRTRQWTCAGRLFFPLLPVGLTRTQTWFSSGCGLQGVIWEL